MDTNPLDFKLGNSLAVAFVVGLVTYAVLEFKRIN